MGDGFLGLAELEIDIAQVVVHRGILPHAVPERARTKACSAASSRRVLPVVNPAETIQIRPVIRIQFQGARNQLLRFVQSHSAVGEHVAKIVHRAGVVRIQLQHLAEFGFGAASDFFRRSYMAPRMK